MKYADFLVACNQLLVIGINMLGFLGITLILYSVVSTTTQNKWLVLENLADGISVYATLIGTILTAASVYFPENTRLPDPVSKIFTAPVVIVSVLVAFWFLWFDRSHRIPPHVINGFSLLAMSGALFRLLSR
jgi:hypothetical protein